MATMDTKAVVPLLVAMMLLTGVCNTLLTKYQDMQCVYNCDDPNPKRHKLFEQPVWQTVQMFIGEMGCALVIAASSIYSRLQARRVSGYIRVGTSETDAAQERLLNNANANDAPDSAAANLVVDATSIPPEREVEQRQAANTEARVPLEGWRVIILAMPSTCDILATTLMNVGLLFTAASIYQMTRGMLVLFVGLFSVMFLRRHLPLYKWVALVLVVAGVAVVGLAGVIERKHQDDIGALDAIPNQDDEEPRDEALLTVIGIMMIAMAQIFTASQFVLEESIMHKYEMSPLNVVAWEGVFGFTVTLAFMLVAHLAYGHAHPQSPFNAVTGWNQMTTKTIGLTSILIMISIGGFNFFGLSVTRRVSATSRSTIDTCRTLFIWIVSLGLGWESFKWLQILGFAILVYGTFLFNDIIGTRIRLRGSRNRAM